MERMMERMDDWDHGYLEGLAGNPPMGEGVQYIRGYEVGKHDRLDVIGGHAA